MKLIQLVAVYVFTFCSVVLSSCTPDTEEKTVRVETSVKSDSSQGVLSDAQERTLKKAHETEEVLKDVERKRLETLGSAE